MVLMNLSAWKEWREGNKEWTCDTAREYDKKQDLWRK